MLILPYKGGPCPKNINGEINRHLPKNIKVQIIYSGTKLGKETNIKDVTNNDEHQHDLIYNVKCP